MWDLKVVDIEKSFPLTLLQAIEANGNQLVIKVPQISTFPWDDAKLSVYVCVYFILFLPQNYIKPPQSS